MTIAVMLKHDAAAQEVATRQIVAAGKQLKARCGALGVPWRTVAELVGMPSNRLWRLTRGEGSLVSLIEVATALGCEIEIRVVQPMPDPAVLEE